VTAPPAPSDRPWAVLQHVAHEGPGSIGAVLGDHGVVTTVVRLDRGDPLPDIGSIGGLVVMGGPMCVHDDAVHGWLADERALIRETVDAGRPVLGVCLGAQQLAAALGAEVTTGPVAEIGPGQVELTTEGRRDPVLGPEYHGLSGTSVPCVHWHRDTFGLPDGAVHLAATRTFPHQAFRWGSRVYGLQFHVEVDDGLASAWRPLLPDGVVLDDAAVARVRGVGRRVLGRFVEIAVSDPVAVADGAGAVR
jgi:GMP synthase-like glutamine amidotransferase